MLPFIATVYGVPVYSGAKLPRCQITAVPNVSHPSSIVGIFGYKFLPFGSIKHFFKAPTRRRPK
jgi:hypothetical protein